MEDPILAIVRRQHGLVKRPQALAAGLSDDQISYRVRTGAWQRLGRGLYRHGAVTPTWRSNLLADCLLLDGLASHRSAAVLHAIDGFKPGRRELVVRRGRARPADRVILHDSLQFDLAAPTRIDAIPCTGLARTVLDLAAVVGPNKLEDTIDAVIRDRRLDWLDLYDVLVRHSARGRDGCGRLRTILERRFGDQRPPKSGWSRRVQALLFDAGLREADLEYVIDDSGGTFIAQVDLAFPEHRVVIELDSERWHLNRHSFRKDPKRRNRLTTNGWTVLTFTWSDYVDEPACLVTTVKDALPATAPIL